MSLGLVIAQHKQTFSWSGILFKQEDLSVYRIDWDGPIPVDDEDAESVYVPETAHPLMDK